MTGRAEVERLKEVLEATFKRASTIKDAELLSDYAKYLCVLVSGFLEQSVIELLLEHARRHSQPRIQRYVESQARRLRNLKSRRLIDVIGSFDPDWRKDLEDFIVDERKAAVDSVVELRNTIAHGQHTTLTMTRIHIYYGDVSLVVSRIADLCVP